MTRLIDADDIVLDYSGLAIIPPLDFRGIAEYFAKQINAMSTIDAVPVIRCKYCQSWKENECNLPEFGWCGTLQMLTHAGDYCTWSPNLDDEDEE